MSTLARTTAIVTVGVLLAGCGDDGNDLATGRASDGGLGIEVVPRDDGTLPAPADEPAAPVATTAPDARGDEPAATDDDEAMSMADDDGDAAHADEAHADEAHADEAHADEAHADEAHADDDHAADQETDDGHADDGQAADAQAAETTVPDEQADTEVAEPVDEGFVVHVEMIEFGYVADQTVLPMGEDVIFRFVNTGAIPHEAMLGSEHQQEEFAAAGDHGDHGDHGHHGEVIAITLDAGGEGDLVVRFEEPGELWIGCHLPGHWDAGMFATFEVA